MAHPDIIAAVKAAQANMAHQVEAVFCPNVSGPRVDVTFYTPMGREIMSAQFFPNASPDAVVRVVQAIDAALPA